MTYLFSVAIESHDIVRRSRLVPFKLIEPSSVGLITWTDQLEAFLAIPSFLLDENYSCDNVISLGCRQVTYFSLSSCGSGNMSTICNDYDL